MEPHSCRVLNRRTKMVTFRVSFEEYEKLKVFCLSKGQRSVSDLARNALSAMVESGGVPDVQARLTDMEHQLRMLASEINRLSGAQEIVLRTEESH